MSAEQNPQKEQRILSREIEDEMRQSYLDYAMSVIVGRALPDVRDGLKPVHRRVLYTMYETGLLHNKPFKKSANVVGNCMARYHPHGDSAIYDTLVRMVQPFSLRYPLIQGQGNFGSIDGDSAAAMRYTECRLQRMAEDMIDDIEKETVQTVPNFDGSLTEPAVLPSKIPNLLINGSSGIAVGMATNIPPHNLQEVCDAAIRIIDEPDLQLPAIMAILKGPDFPTGAQIIGRQGILTAYATGRGKISVRCSTTTEERGGKKSIIVTEIPYLVNKSMLIEEIATAVKDKKVIGVTDLRDESDKEGMRIVIELRRDANEEVVLNQLYTFSRLQDTFGINMVCLVDGKPQTLGIKDLIVHYINHRRVVVRKRTAFDLERAREKAHLLEGLVIALQHIDEVISIIKKAKEAEDARASLIVRFCLSEKQAGAILEMRLGRLTSLEQVKLHEDLAATKVLIEELEGVLADEHKILSIIKQELSELKERYGNERRTKLVDNGEEYIDIEDLIKAEDMVVTVTNRGYVKRLPIDTYRQQHRGGKGVTGATVSDDDFVENLFIANTHSHILFFTSTGMVHWLKVYQIPEASRTSKGKAIINLLELDQSERITAFVPVSSFDDRHYLFLTTHQGIVKKTELSAFSHPRRGGIRAINLEGQDQLINAKITDGNEQVILATREGMAVKFHERQVRPTGRTAQGVRGIRLRKDDLVVGMVIAKDDNTLLTITENGFGKRSKIDEYRLINRGGIGVISIQCSERNGKVVAVKSIKDTDELIMMSKSGNVIRTWSKSVPVIGRNTQGVRLMRLDSGDKLVSVEKIISEAQQLEKLEAEAREAAARPAPVSAPAQADDALAEEDAIDADEDGDDSQDDDNPQEP